MKVVMLRPWLLPALKVKKQQEQISAHEYGYLYLTNTTTLLSLNGTEA